MTYELATTDAYDSQGDLIIRTDRTARKNVVKYGVLVEFGGTEHEISYRQYLEYKATMELGADALFRTKSDTMIKSSKIAKIEVREAEREYEKLPTGSKYLKRLDVENWTLMTSKQNGVDRKTITREQAREIQRKLQRGEKLPYRVMSIDPIYTTADVIEQREGRDFLVERPAGHKYQPVPMTRIDETGEEVVLWYWQVQGQDRSGNDIVKKAVRYIVFDYGKDEFVEEEKVNERKK